MESSLLNAILQNPATAEKHYMVARSYLKEQKYDAAFRRFKKAASYGSIDAYNNLGDCCLFGQGTEKNPDEAYKYYKKAAEKGSPLGQANLGYCYTYGIGVKQDYVQSVYWYRKAAEQGDHGAQYNLGNRYVQGQGVGKDIQEALRWYTKADENGNPVACFMIGWLYYDGKDVPQDYRRAFRMFEKCVQTANHRQAHYYLGVMYLYGRGVNRNYMMARDHLFVSAIQGYEDAVLLLQEHRGKFVNEDLTKSFLSWIYTQNTRNPPAVAPDMQLTQLSMKCIESGMDYYMHLGTIAEQLYNIAISIMPEIQAKNIDFLTLATEWMLGRK